MLYNLSYYLVMAFRFQKRIRITKNLGINVSKTGITPSLKTKRGSISSKGYSLRTGISGVSYGKKFSKSSKGCAGIFLLSIFISLIIILIK